MIKYFLPYPNLNDIRKTIYQNNTQYFYHDYGEDISKMHILLKFKTFGCWKVLNIIH